MENTNNVTFHIYNDDNDLSLADIREAIDQIALSYNDILREYHISNAEFKTYSPKLNNVENGSLILTVAVDLLAKVIAGVVTAAAVGAAKIIYKKIKERLTKSDKDDVYEITIDGETKINIKVKKKQ